TGSAPSCAPSRGPRRAASSRWAQSWPGPTYARTSSRATRVAPTPWSAPTPRRHARRTARPNSWSAARASPAARGSTTSRSTEADDLIEPSVNGSAIQFRNVTRARLAGLDVALTAQRLIARLTTSLAYTFLYARALASDSAPGGPLAFRPKHLLTLSADYQWH